jgi:ABC-type sulfate/molybdate transport systems ATPase subunit
MLVPLHVKHLRKKIGSFILTADFTVGVGERVALVGKSGSGKSSLLRLIAGLDELNPEVGDEGQIFLGDQDLSSLTPQKRAIGFVFQEPTLFPVLSVIQNVAFGLQVRDVSKAEREKQALEWLDRVGLKNQAFSEVTRLSGGEKQRVALVRALIWKPQLLLLDEPFSALDVDLRQSLRQLVLELHALWPVPLLWVTHDPIDVQVMATSSLQLVHEQVHERVGEQIYEQSIRKIIRNS